MSISFKNWYKKKTIPEKNLNNCKILLIDSPAETILMEEVLNCLSLPISLRCCSSLSEAIQEIELETPDMIMIGLGMLIRHGFEIFQHIKGIPTAILCEGEGCEIMFKESYSDILFLSRPFGLDGMEEMFQKALEFVNSQKEK